MEVMIQEQDKRAVESMCRCGLDIDRVIAFFPKFSRGYCADIRSFKRSGWRGWRGKSQKCQLFIMCFAIFPWRVTMFFICGIICRMKNF